MLVGYSIFASVSSKVDQRVSELLIKAMKARDAGNLQQAEVFWHQARTFKPDLRKPTWLKQKNEIASPMRGLENIHISLDNLSYAEAKEILLERIAMSPGNKELRKRLLVMALESGDPKEAARQRAFLGITETKGKEINWYTVLFLGIIVFLIVWQLFCLIKKQISG